MNSKLAAFTLAWLLNLTLLLGSGEAAAQGSIQITDTGPKVDFPESITFSADIRSDSPIQSVVLEYGVDQLACGRVVAKAFPEFQPGKTTSAEWTWEMRQSGSLPPGARVWWEWHVTDSSGAEAVSPRGQVTFLDDVHGWKSLQADGVNLHWYQGDDHFGQSLHDSAVQALAWLKQQAGLTSDSPVDLYIYGSTGDLRDAILYEPSWIGGQAFPDQNIVIIGITPEDIEWGKHAIAHELTHVLVGHFTFSCLGDVPAWLNEGLASFSEGSLEPSSQALFDQAVKNDTLIPLRALSGSFSEEPTKADLSYSQSYSVVNFIIQEYGQDKMNRLLMALRDGATVDDALVEVYGFDVDGLDNAWRTAIGAPSRAILQPSPTPQPTAVPTFKPISGLLETPAAPTLPPLPSATPTPTRVPARTSFPGTAGVPILISAALGCLCLIVLVLVGAGLLLRRERKT